MLKLNARRALPTLVLTVLFSLSAFGEDSGADQLETPATPAAAPSSTPVQQRRPTQTGF